MWTSWHPQLLRKVANKNRDLDIFGADTLPADPWLSANSNPGKLRGSKLYMTISVVIQQVKCI